MRNKEAVIFDVGNVLVKLTNTGEKFVRLMQSMHISPDQASEKFGSLREVVQHNTGELDSPALHKFAESRFSLRCGYDEFVEGWCDIFQPNEEMREMVETLATRYKIGILSDTDPLHWNHLIGCMPWLAMVKNPTLSYRVGFLKPHPKMYEAAARNVGCAKDECLFIDDKIANVDGARYYGMPALRFESVEKLRRDLKGLGLL